MSVQPLFVSASRGFVAALGNEVLLKILGFVATFFVLRELGPYEYGLWQLLLSTGIAFGAVTVPGIASMLVADLSRELGAGNVARANGIVVRSTGLFVGLSVLAGLALYFAAPFIRTISGIDMVSFMQLLAISVAVVGVRQSYQMMLQAHLQFIHSQIMKTIDRLAYVIGILFFIVGMGLGIEGVVYAYVLSTCASVIIYAPYMLRMFAKSIAHAEGTDWAPFKEAILGRGKWALGTDLVNAAIGSFWPWLVGFFLSIETVGFVSIALLVLGQSAALVPISYVLRSVLPRTVTDPVRAKDWLFRSMKFSFWGNMITGIAVVAACVVLFPIFFPQHVPALPLLAMLILTLPLRGMAVTAAEWFYAHGLQRELFFVSTVPKVIIYATLPLFLWAGGIFGYALWYILSSDVVLYARIRIISQRLGDMLTVKFLLRADETDIDIAGRIVMLVRERVRRLRA